jgi:hypothetical protein
MQQVYVTINNSNSFPNGVLGNSGLLTNNTFLNSIFSSNGVVRFYPAYPAAYRNDAPLGCVPLKSVYFVELPKSNASNLISALTTCTNCNDLIFI